jgi:hypothetical protein
VEVAVWESVAGSAAFVVVVVPPEEQVLGAPGSATPSPSASHEVVDGSMPVVTGADSEVAVPLESVLAKALALCRLCLALLDVVVPVPPVEA